MGRRTREARRAARATLKLRSVLDEVIDAGGAPAAAAARLLGWAEQTAAAAAEQQQQARDDAGVADDEEDATADADADDGGDGAPAHALQQLQRLQQQQQQQEQQQQQQQQETDGDAVEHTLSRLHRAGPEQREEWDFRRRSGGSHKDQCGTGNAAGTREARLRWSTLSVVCQQHGCCALVDYKRARDEAKRAGRRHFVPGDGCAGRPPCSAVHRPPRFAQRQTEYANKVEAGERTLICWPASLDDKEEWVLPPQLAGVAVAAARAAVRH